MLQKETSKKLREQNWRAIARKEINLSDTLLRFRGQSIKAINELILLTNKLPNEEQEKIFYYEKIEGLIQAILHGNNERLHYYSKDGDKSVFKGGNAYYDNNFNSRITHIAALLVREGIKICIDQYKTKIERDSRLNQATIEKLNNAAEICDAIAFKLYSPSIELAVKEEKLTYLFNWNKITSTSSDSADNISGEDNRRLFQFLKDKLGSTLNKLIEERAFEVNEISIKKYEAYNKFSKQEDRLIYCDIIRRPTERIHCVLRLCDSRGIVEFTMDDRTGFTTQYGKEELIIKPVKGELIAKQKYGNCYIYTKNTFQR